ncbi:12379_t:CDS:1 [Cetraspora pellucida]|uniref:12379_t:CDS:1 n=1 Tax=Cetraspora pellucida TaxID=1433469 RepID=A0ACA9KQW4_9GLOM|nr:12379_t:CDS:1 [Cetraspora pellucida]
MTEKLSYNHNLGLDVVSEPNIASQQEWIFIDESDIITSPAQSLRPLIPDQNLHINVPFPPEINPVDLIRRNKNGELLSRATNKFLIYRNEYAKELQARGFKLSMREVSRMAAQSWKKEPQQVKRKYEDIAREVEKLHVQLSMSSSPGWDRRRGCFTQNPNEMQPNHKYQRDHCSILPSVTVPSSYLPYHYIPTTIPMPTVPSQNSYSSIQSVDCRQSYYLLDQACGNPQMDFIQYGDLPTPNLDINFNNSLESSPESFNCELPVQGVILDHYDNLNSFV